MLFFNDRSAATCSGSNCELLDASSLNLTGALYFKRQELTFQGSAAGTGPWQMIIADKLLISGGSASLGSDYSGGVPLPTTKPSLVE